MKKHVLSLGGSIVVPDEVDVDFLINFKKLIIKYIPENVFYFIVGGGKTCRKYQNVLRDLNINEDGALDWMGIKSTHLNAFLLKSLFGDLTSDEIIIDPSDLPEEGKQIYFGGGWKPGWSTDYVSVMLAKELGLKTVVNLSNIDYVYDKDPRKHDDAQPLKTASWAQIRALVGDKWVPGANLPFDPIACKLAEKEGSSVIIMKGTNLENLEQYFKGEAFEGTVIG